MRSLFHLFCDFLMTNIRISYNTDFSLMSWPNIKNWNLTKFISKNNKGKGFIRGCKVNLEGI